MILKQDLIKSSGVDAGGRVPVLKVVHDIPSTPHTWSPGLLTSPHLI